MPMPVDPQTGLPMAPDVPPGWSISPQGIPIDPGGVLHPEMVNGAAAASEFPLASVAVGAAAGWSMGKDKGKGQMWGMLGAAAGYFLKPLE